MIIGQLGPCPKSLWLHDGEPDQLDTRAARQFCSQPPLPAAQQLCSPQHYFCPGALGNVSLPLIHTLILQNHYDTDAVLRLF